jgi:hypothetical protein
MRKVSGCVVLACTLLIHGQGFSRPDRPALPADGDAIPVLEEVLVTGDQPGPGLWKVSRDGHVLWVLASLSPLPARMRWDTGDVEARIGESQVVLAPPTVSFAIEGGRIRALLLLPKLLGARKNPDDRRLADIVPPSVYRQWQTLKARHMPRNRRVERWRPLFAAQALYEEAVEDAGLRLSPMVWSTVRKLARRLDVDIVTPTVELRIENPGDTLTSFARSPLDDVACFTRTMDRLEADLANMRERANAWAVGDLESLASLSTVDPTKTCIESVINSAVMSDSGLDDIPDRVRRAWLAAAEQALAENISSFAVLPLFLVLADDGPIADLRARGYSVEAPP